MSYTVLARRYRSRSFDELVGQDAVARTLANAIERGRVGHAYLFCGTRGVGKTSLARIFAKALNAPDDKPKDVAEAIMQGRDTDVIEIDAASNRGVDEARELIANSVYRPMRGRYKIYIIDEVHMLTREAFNALLKTMEEPPEHVKFILCTTEAHKVPPTIQSRCQRFDFKNIDSRRIGEHLRSVLKQEKVEAEPSVVAQVARLANGSMRDSLTLMDRLLATGEKKLTSALLHDILGLPQGDLIDALLGACAEGSLKGALESGDALLQSGVTIDQALESIVSRLRDVLIIAACGHDSEIAELEGEDRERAAALADRLDDAGIVHMIALCENAARSARSSSTPRALFDAVVARMAMTERIADAAALARSGAASGPPASGGRALAGASSEPPKKAGAPAGGEPARSARPEPTADARGDAARPAIPCAATGDLWASMREQAPPGVRSVLRPLTLAAQTRDSITLRAGDEYTLKFAQSRLDAIRQFASELAGRPIGVTLVGAAPARREEEPGATGASGAPGAPGGSGARPRPAQSGLTVAEREAMEHPLVRTAIDLFGARLVRVETDSDDDLAEGQSREDAGV
ncbi:MAG: DNA polymerase III subunit gamma/tau [Phycisphaeraceae bacterium]|nr:DNA polymerase III subunit gamma/tau [Phycisphaeraceae bacterium]